ncbi:MAG: hypothetical protein J1F23_04140 [Oscillospiraceae bacterium]|nr:hypothetical protein [Oscillospiraceae bacterium]
MIYNYQDCYKVLFNGYLFFLVLLPVIFIILLFIILFKIKKKEIDKPIGIVFIFFLGMVLSIAFIGFLNKLTLIVNFDKIYKSGNALQVTGVLNIIEDVNEKDKYETHSLSIQVGDKKLDCELPFSSEAVDRLKEKEGQNVLVYYVEHEENIIFSIEVLSDNTGDGSVS